MKLNYFKIFRNLMPRAKEIYNDKDKFRKLIDKSIKRTSGKHLFKSISHDLKIIFSLAHDFIGGRYRNIGKFNILLIIVSLIYLLNPLDIIPDFLIGFGFIDDLTIITYLITKIKGELDKYEKWREINAGI